MFCAAPPLPELERWPLTAHMKAPLSSLLNRLKGISTPFGGLTWEPTPDEKTLAAETLTILEARRVVHPHTSRNNPVKGAYARDSIEELRDELKGVCIKTPAQSELRNGLLQIISACNDCLAALDDYVPVQGEFGQLLVVPGADPIEGVATITEILSEFRFRVWFCMLTIATQYSVPVSTPFHDLLPAPNPSESIVA